MNHEENTLGEHEKEEKKFKCGCVYPCRDYPSCGGTKISFGVEERVEEKGTEQVGYVNQLFDTLKKYYSDQDRTLAQMLKTISDLESQLAEKDKEIKELRNDTKLLFACLIDEHQIEEWKRSRGSGTIEPWQEQALSVIERIESEIFKP